MIQKIINGRTDLVFDFVAQGHSPSAVDDNGVSLIQWCAYFGDVSAIKFLVANGVAVEDLGENLDLIGACFHGHWQLCQYLIELGADVNAAMASTGETPLHAALCKANRPSYVHIVNLLLAAGANPNCKTIASATTGSFMRDCRTKAETPLHRAAAFGSENSIQFILNAGGDIRAKDVNGDSPLTWASWHLRPANILKMLCYDEFSVHPNNNATYDHGLGWGQSDMSLLGEPII